MHAVRFIHSNSIHIHVYIDESLGIFFGVNIGIYSHVISRNFTYSSCYMHFII